VTVKEALNKGMFEIIGSLFLRKESQIESANGLNQRFPRFQRTELATFVVYLRTVRRRSPTEV
jgi:hypothetical protein